MRNNNVSTNAREAFQQYKEELAKDISIDVNEKQELQRDINREYKEDSITNLRNSLQQ